ncbi:MAG: Tm-1-like ATP-binding domain-containing protein, partial [Actinomycetia bacterium]|nr:Tm-1-like ATP-binding domain-containing protein [Actinomycetes bacterium]
VADLYAQNKVHGVLALGGGAGTTIGSTVMQALPLGVPKVILSTVAAGDTTGYLGTADIVMYPSIVDVAGVNKISQLTYTRPADAMAGMLDGLNSATQPKATAPSPRPLVAASMFGVTTPCIQHAQRILEAAGCEVLIFHATGVGGRTLERLVSERFFDAVLDLTTTEWADEIVGGILSAGPTRLSAAAAAGIPQVVSLGATDMVNFGRPESIPTPFAGRTFYHHNAENTLMRTTTSEATNIGHAIGRQLDTTQGETVLLIPRRGVSMLDAAGQPFDDPAARQALTTAVRDQLTNPRVQIEEHDLHVNDPAFAEAAANKLLAALGLAPTKPDHVRTQ